MKKIWCLLGFHKWVSYSGRVIVDGKHYRLLKCRVCFKAIIKDYYLCGEHFDL